VSHWRGPVLSASSWAPVGLVDAAAWRSLAASATPGGLYGARSAPAGSLLLGGLDAARALSIAQIARPRGVAAAGAKHRPAADVAARVAGAFCSVAPPVGVAARAAPFPPRRRRAPDLAVAALAAPRAGAPGHDYSRCDPRIARILPLSVIAERGPVGQRLSPVAPVLAMLTCNRYTGSRGVVSAASGKRVER
jgi:hypothetical protein